MSAVNPLGSRAAVMVKTEPIDSKIGDKGRAASTLGVQVGTSSPFPHRALACSTGDPFPPSDYEFGGRDMDVSYAVPSWCPFHTPEELAAVPYLKATSSVAP